MSFTDDFNRADGPVGNGWTVTGPALGWAVSSNRLAVTSGSGDGTLLRDAATTDVVVKAKLNGDPSSSGLVARAVDNSNFLLLDLSGTDANLYVKTSGSYSFVSTPTTVVPGDVLELETRGATVLVRKNGVEVYRNESFGFGGATGNLVGFRKDTANNNPFNWDDFSWVSSNATSVAVPGEAATAVLAAPAGDVALLNFPGYEDAYSGDATPVAAAVAGQVATVGVAAPAGDVSGSANVEGALASEIYLITAHPGSVSSASAVSNSVAVDGPVATVSFGAPRGALTASSSTSTQMPVGGVATVVLAAPAGSVSATTGGGGGGAAVGSVNGATATVVLAAHPGTVSSPPIIAGPSAAITLAAPVGSVVTYTVNRADLVLTMSLIDSDVPVQPGTLRASVYNGTAYATVYFFLDGAATHFHSAALDETGSATVALPINNVTVGSHAVRVSETTTLPAATTVNDKAFTVSGAPAPVYVAPTPQTPPAPPDAPIDYWVFQAYDFSSLDNVETYTLPVNPKEYEPSYGGFAISSEPTTVSSGTVVSWEGVAPPETMRWSGRILTKEDHAAMLKVGVTGQRIWVTDHFRRRFLVKIASFTPQRVRDRARPWHHEYEMTAWVLQGEGVLVG